MPILSFATLFFIVLTGYLGDTDSPLFEASQERHHFVKCDRSAHDNLGDLVLSVFDPLGDFNLTFAGQQGNLPHFTQIHPNRVTGTTEGSGLQFYFVFILIVIAVTLGFDFVFRLNDFNVHLTEHGHDVLKLLRGDHVGRKHVIDLVIGQKALLFSQFDKLLDFFWITFLCHFSSLLLRNRKCGYLDQSA